MIESITNFLKSGESLPVILRYPEPRGLTSDLRYSDECILYTITKVASHISTNYLSASSEIQFCAHHGYIFSLNEIKFLSFTGLILEATSETPCLLIGWVLYWEWQQNCDHKTWEAGNPCGVHTNTKSKIFHFVGKKKTFLKLHQKGISALQSRTFSL